MTERLDQVSRAFALLVGVGDYSAYDASAGKPAGASDLPAGRNDVGAFYRMCRALGVPHANIHILTSPKLAPGDAGEPGEQIPCGYLGEATGAEIRAQLAWLAGALAHAEGDTDAPVGLFTYSGHGDFAGDHLALCPSDVRAGAGDLEGALGFPEIQSILKSQPGGADGLTVILDCCHAAAAAPGARGKSSRRAGASLTGRARKPTSELHVFGGRMLMAAAPGQVAYQSKFDGHDHGALTWALNVVADQWRVESEGDVDHYTIDHGTLRERARRLLRALGFAQKPALYPEGVAQLPFFHRGKGDASDVVAKTPDRQRHPIQLDPNELGGFDYTLYTFTLLSGETSQVLSVGTSNNDLGYVGGKEYWNLSQDFIDAWEKGEYGTLWLGGVSGNWGTPARAPAAWTGSTSSPILASLPGWTSSGGDPPSGTYFFNGVGICVGGTSAAPVVRWFREGPTGSAPGGYAVGPSGSTFSRYPATPRPGNCWYVPTTQNR